MVHRSLNDLSRRERQIMDIVYERGLTSAAEVREDLDEPPSYSAVRAALRVLVEKGHLRHRQDGPRYLYEPTAPKGKVRKTALRRVLHTFFGGSTEQAVAALLDLSDARLTDGDLDRLGRLIEERKGKGRSS